MASAAGLSAAAGAALEAEGAAAPTYRSYATTTTPTRATAATTTPTKRATVRKSCIKQISRLIVQFKG